MSIHQNPAIVLRHVDFRESDRVVTVFTRDQGRISGLARGVRRSVKRFAGRLDLFAHVNLQYREGRGELYSLEGADLISAHLSLRDDLYKIAWAGYLSELVERLYGVGEPHPEAFALLLGALKYLCETPEPREGVLRAFELRLLAEAGLQPELEVCVNCRTRVGSTLRYSFVVTRGGPLCERCAPLQSGQAVPVGTMTMLARALTLPVEQLGALELSDLEARGARDLLGSFLRYHVGAPLKSAPFLTSLLPDAVPR